MRRFLYYSNTTNGANPSQTDPIAAVDYYNYLKGFWKDGSKFVYGGSGHISDAEADPDTPCDFMFPGDTDPLGWGTNGVPQDHGLNKQATIPLMTGDLFNLRDLLFLSLELLIILLLEWHGQEPPEEIIASVETLKSR